MKLCQVYGNQALCCSGGVWGSRLCLHGGIFWVWVSFYCSWGIVILSPFSLPRTRVEPHRALFSSHWLHGCPQLCCPHWAARNLLTQPPINSANHLSGGPMRTVIHGCLSLPKCNSLSCLSYWWSVTEAMVASDEVAVNRPLLHPCFPSGDILATQDLPPQEPVPWVTFWF